MCTCPATGCGTRVRAVTRQGSAFMSSPAIMSIRVPILSGYAKVSHRIVSLPLIAALLDDPRYSIAPAAAAPPVRPPGWEFNADRVDEILEVRPHGDKLSADSFGAIDGSDRDHAQFVRVRPPQRAAMTLANSAETRRSGNARLIADRALKSASLQRSKIVLPLGVASKSGMTKPGVDASIALRAGLTSRTCCSVTTSCETVPRLVARRLGARLDVFRAVRKTSRLHVKCARRSRRGRGRSHAGRVAIYPVRGRFHRKKLETRCVSIVPAVA